ncbi:MAG: hypothetical protein N838_30505 [Thiohalocapsa sp. PB-PSB1]|nr:MAG: hypothetical protein N838_30505 [Thiohalocapsa sp. PB-PSB1]
MAYVLPVEARLARGWNGRRVAEHQGQRTASELTIIPKPATLGAYAACLL